MAADSSLRSVDEHLRRVLDSISPLAPYGQPLLEGVGLPLGEDVVSQIDLPRLGNPAPGPRGPAAARGGRPADRRGRGVADRPASLRQLRDGRLRGLPRRCGQRLRGAPAPPARGGRVGRRRHQPARAPRPPPRAAGGSPAGPTSPYALAPGTAIKIMTGAPMPEGADTVVPI